MPAARFAMWKQLQRTQKDQLQSHRAGNTELTLQSAGSKSVLLALNYSLFSSHKPQNNVYFMKRTDHISI